MELNDLDDQKDFIDQILKNDYEDWTVRDAIELAKVVAQDFHTIMMCIKM